MIRRGRIFVLLLLAMFAAGTAMHAAAATDMAVTMSAVVDHGSAGDCDGCPGEEPAASPCNQACAMPFTAIPASAAAALVVKARTAVATPQVRPEGRTGPPDPYPPKPFV